MPQSGILGRMPLTLSLIGITVVLAALTSFGADRHLLSGLYISNFTWGGLREVFQGDDELVYRCKSAGSGRSRQPA